MNVSSGRRKHKGQTRRICSGFVLSLETRLVIVPCCAFTVLQKKEIDMQRIFSAIGQAFGKSILVFSLMTLLSLSGLFVFTNQPALADKPLGRPTDEAVERAYTMSEATGFKEEDRQEAYDEAAEAINDPKGLDKIYQEDLKEFKQENPGATGLVQEAKKVVEKVTGKE